MGRFSNAWNALWGAGFQATRRNDGTYSYMLGGNPDFGIGSDYLELSLTNIALFSAFQMRSTMFSRAEIKVFDKDDKELEDDPALKLFANPNFCESQQDFLKKHLWFKSLGTGMTRLMPKRINGSVNDVDNVASLEHLIPSLVDRGESIRHKNFAFSRSERQEINERKIKYRLSGMDYEIPVSEIAFFYDIACNMKEDNFFKSPSRIDALTKEICNIEEAQSGKNKNLIFSHKWLATNKKTEMNTSVNLEADEKNEIEVGLFAKSMNATNADVNVQSLSNDFRKLLYDDNIASDAMRIFSTYGINRNVLNWWADGQSGLGNSGETVEKSAVEWIQNSIQLEADDFANTYNNIWNYRESGKRIELSYRHLPVMQILESKRMESIKKQAEIFDILIKGGFTLEDAKRISGLDETEA